MLSSSMAFLATPLFLLVVQQCGSVLGVAIGGGLEPPPPRPVNQLCAATLCLQGTVCRILNGQSACLPCVPEGVDDVCNNNRYLEALLIGSQDNLRSVRGQPCVPGSCPLGSVCARNDKGVGNCCTGKPDPAPAPGTPVSNGHPICPTTQPRCPGGCGYNEVCRKVVVQCVKAPCDPIYMCVPREKRGSCPFVVLGFTDDCVPLRKCDNDCDCPGSLKCCINSCGGRECKRPFPRF